MTGWIDFIWRLIASIALGYCVGNVMGLRLAYRRLQRSVVHILALRLVDLGNQMKEIGAACPGCGGSQAHTEDCGITEANRMIKEEIEAIKAGRKREP